jgi:hypothetical protein
MTHENREVDERCLALLHAARIGDAATVRTIANNICFLCHHGSRPSAGGMDNLMQVLTSAQWASKASRSEGLTHLVGREEVNAYDPEASKVTDQEKAESLYHKWRNETRP